MTRTFGITWFVIAIAICSVFGGDEPEPLPATLYEEWRRSPSPVQNSQAPTNPPSLQWRSVKHWENRDVRYRVELSNEPSFPRDRTMVSESQRYCFFNPHTKLDTGIWYWRYEVRDGVDRTVHGPFQFLIDDKTPVFESPSFAALVPNLSVSHPRFITQGKTLEEVRNSAKKHPLANSIIDKGRKAIKVAIYDGPISDPNPAHQRSFERNASREIGVFHSLIDAYVLANDKELKDIILKRIEILLQWPTDDLLGSQVLTALAKFHDAMWEEVPELTRNRVLIAIDKQLRKGLTLWPGRIEGRQVENHFWQMELPGNFMAALATIGELESSREMLEYTYELFIARFPNLSTPDGAWCEGLGYFGVNKATIVDMAVLLKHVCKVDVFKMEWYQTLAKYFIYFSPINGRIDGFGDMHDRVGNGNIGHAMMLVLSEENQDPLARYRLASLLNAKNDKAENEPWDYELTVEPWYQIVHGVRFDPTKSVSPINFSQSRLFRGVGLAALHTDVLNSERDTALYFRSSPFGAKGHMHANQNAFNISRCGEPLFYSSGYYTSFADPHSLNSYRHTRAHNAILVNGCGQAFGHEGYGWIKRFLPGEQISYVCGDATMAYRDTVDKQFIGLLQESGVDPTPANGYGDSKLKLFERHVALIRPDVVVIYDVLEAAVASDWTYLLHTMERPHLNSKGELQLLTKKNFSSVLVLGTQKLRYEITNRFYSPPIDIKSKYRETPEQFQMSWTSFTKTSKMRFLSVFRMADVGEPLNPIEQKDDCFLIGDYCIRAELDIDKPAFISIESDTAKLFVNDLPTIVFNKRIPLPEKPASLLAEKNANDISLLVDQNMTPHSSPSKGR